MGPAQQGPAARLQLAEVERLHEVVVGPVIEHPDLLVDRRARRQHQHGRAGTSLTQPAQDRRAVEPGQHEVEHHEVVALGPQELVGFDAVRGRIHGVAELLQPSRDRLREVSGVFDDQDPHRRPRAGCSFFAPAWA
jgi:hypothetical protein